MYFRPHLGETRNIKFEKSIEPLGIQIESGSLGGIFVSSVSDNSLANKAGINVGDQLLEVCTANCFCPFCSVCVCVCTSCLNLKMEEMY